MYATRFCSRLRLGEFVNRKSINNLVNSSARLPRLSNAHETLLQNRKKSSSVGKYPSIEKSKSLPLSYSEMSNETLNILASLDVLEATEEVLKRHIMR